MLVMIKTWPVGVREARHGMARSSVDGSSLVHPVRVLLHVLRQVSLLQWPLVSHRLHIYNIYIKSFPYLGVGLAAIGTDVSLHVF